MKIAIVVPWVPRIMGISLACAFSRALSELGETVEFIVHTLNVPFENELKRILMGKVKLTILNKVHDGKISPFIYLKKQYFSQMAGDIVEFIVSSKDRYDILMLISNEGKSLGNVINKKFRNNPKDKPITVLLTQELIDYTFTINKDGLSNHFRRIFSISKPFFRYIEISRMHGFDLIYSNSNWTSKNLLNLYGIKSRMSLALYDDKNFKMDCMDDKLSQIAVPTASLDDYGSELLLHLQNDGIPLITFGPKKLNGLKNLGFLSIKDMHRVVSLSKATLFYFDYEALGLIPFESLSLGTPVITIPKQGPYEELKNNRFVYFFNNYDSLLRICRNLLSTDQDSAYRNSCSNSVNAFRSEAVAGFFLEDIRNYIRGE